MLKSSRLDMCSKTRGKKGFLRRFLEIFHIKKQLFLLSFGLNSYQIVIILLKQ